MIVVRLNGGLGNQMFQFAAGYALSRRLGVECRADLSSFKRSIRRYALDCFVGAPKIAVGRDLPLSSRLIRCGIPAILATKFGRVFGTTRIFEEQSAFVFDETFSALPDSSYLDGYFHSEKYFANVAADIRTIFTFREPPNAANRKILDDIESVTAVSVHVRRGDYITNPHTKRYHGVCSVEYYEKACRMIAERVQNVKFFIFSDDPDWVRENIRPPAETTYVGHNKDDLAHEDMRLMSNCRHHVIANSSFSWWGAWLNRFAGKTVIAPRRWVADTSVPTRDLFPEDWIYI